MDFVEVELCLVFIPSSGPLRSRPCLLRSEYLESFFRSPRRAAYPGDYDSLPADVRLCSLPRQVGSCATLGTLWDGESSIPR